MPNCPSCGSSVEDGEKNCPNCGHAIPASSLENIPDKTTGWQKFVIVVGAILLVVIAFTFYGAEKRENAACQEIFSQQAPAIIQNVAFQSGLGRIFGIPAYQIKARPKEAQMVVDFQYGPLTQEQASLFGNGVCAALAQSYVRKGYIPRHLRVVVAGQQPGGRVVYGASIYNGNIDALGWEPAARR